MNETVERIERELERIDAEIARLEQERERVLMSDEEYAGYVEQYCSCYNDDPLPIRQYYELADELSRINAEWQKPDVDYEALWQKHRDRLIYLERVLAA